MEKAQDQNGNQVEDSGVSKFHNQFLKRKKWRRNCGLPLDWTEIVVSKTGLRLLFIFYLKTEWKWYTLWYTMNRVNTKKPWSTVGESEILKKNILIPWNPPLLLLSVRKLNKPVYLVFLWLSSHPITFNIFSNISLFSYKIQKEKKHFYKSMFVSHIWQNIKFFDVHLSLHNWPVETE